MLPPSTIVASESNTELAGLPRTSEETSGSSEYSRMPLSALLAASAKAALTLSIVTALFVSHTRSTTEPFFTGTRIAQPSSLPFSCGSTLPTARAAPVLVGMMFSAAARARRRSL
jgi:hypothetical protein